jgi:hypothetical protein
MSDNISGFLNKKYDCDRCGATVDGKFLQVHNEWHEWLEKLAEKLGRDDVRVHGSKLAR